MDGWMDGWMGREKKQMEDDDGSGGSVDFFRAEKWDGVVAISTSGGTDKGAGPEGGDLTPSDTSEHSEATIHNGGEQECMRSERWVD
jgi:hypothetical protein